MDWLLRLAPVWSGLAGALGAWLLVRHAAKAAPIRNGWRQVRPGAIYGFGIVAGLGLVCFMLYIRLFVGSSRPDAGHQMNVLTGLIAAFTIGIAICAWQARSILRLGAHWRGSQLAYTGQGGERVVRSLTEVAGMRRTWIGNVELAFRDGEVVRLDEHATGVPALCHRIIELNEALDPDRELSPD